MKWFTKIFKELFGYPEPDCNHPPCDEGCPKGGLCHRRICGHFSGRLSVEDLFKCRHIQKQMLDLHNEVYKVKPPKQ